MEYISAIIGKNPYAVDQILGPFEKTEVLKSSPYADSFKGVYREGEIEVVFIDNVADWITLHNKHTNTHTLVEFFTFFQLAKLTPNFAFQTGRRKETRLTYKEVDGISEITVCLTKLHEISYISIKAFTA